MDPLKKEMISCFEKSLILGVWHVLKCIDNVRMLDRFNSKRHSTGSLYLTTTHLIFFDPDNKRETWMLHMHIQSVEKQSLTTTGCPLVIRCKNFLSVTFLVPLERLCHEIYTSLLQLSQPLNVKELYCFHYTACSEDLPKFFGWDFFSIEDEFFRQGVPNKLWAKSDINADYKICDTYPSLLFVPANASRQQLIECSRFRSKGRLPVLTYFYKHNGASICRCSQPLSGLSGKRCPEDEQVFDCILRSNPNASFMYIVDTRPKVNAFAQRMAGKGFESEVFYENMKFQFFGIENIHVMRASLAKLIEASEMRGTNYGAFVSTLESSSWLKHIRAVLETAYFVARQARDGISVIVHCSDGWDRTAQACGLASLLLDPYYRTLKGFQVLIEKDWLSFGHKFMDRCGYIQGDPKEVAPIFTQFLESVWQLQCQFPTAFEFNERFLITVHDHVYSAQFGTFIGNCERERKLELGLSTTTYSLWGHLANNAAAYKNPLYKEDKDFMEPSLSPQGMRYWRGMYNRFEDGVHPREPVGDTLASIRDHTASMNEHAQFLVEQIEALRAELGDFDVKNFVPKNSYSNLEHPLADCNNVNNDCDSITSGSSKLDEEVKSVAIEWSSLRVAAQCSCTVPSDYSSRRFHCWSCGQVFCARCLDKQLALPGHCSKRSVTVCRTCFKLLTKSASLDAT